MFQSYEKNKYLDYNRKTNLYHWEYKIIDREFEEIAVCYVESGFSISIRGIIDTYENRKLNVAANLIRALIWLNKEYGWPISDIVKWTKNHTPKFAKYKENVNNILIFM